MTDSLSCRVGQKRHTALHVTHRTSMRTAVPRLAARGIVSLHPRQRNIAHRLSLSHWRAGSCTPTACSRPHHATQAAPFSAARLLLFSGTAIFMQRRSSCPYPESRRRCCSQCPCAWRCMQCGRRGWCRSWSLPACRWQHWLQWQGTAQACAHEVRERCAVDAHEHQAANDVAECHGDQVVGDEVAEADVSAQCNAQRDCID